MIAGDGRPLRFVAGVAGGWVLLRIVVLWQDTGSLSDAVRGVLPIPPSAIAAAAPPIARPPIDVARHAAFIATPAANPLARPVATPRPPTPADPIRVQLALLAMTRFGTPVEVTDAVGEARPQQSVVLRPVQASLGGTPVPSRISVSSWMTARSGRADGAVLAPQLGGTQGGIRVDYALGGGIAATGRVAAPAAGAGRELSLGVAWKPAGVPLRLVAEQRLGLDGGRGGPALGISGGVDAVPLVAGFALEGYAQGGAIFRGGIDHYLDGSARAARPIAEVGGVAIDAGGGIWGGAQRGVARLDLGPTVGARLPVAGRRLRVSLEWRQRVAGHARPNSGPALSLGTDF